MHLYSKRHGHNIILNDKHIVLYGMCLYRDEHKKHQAQPDNAFIIHKAVLSIKE